MAEKIKAPLIEAIFEIRWGRKDQNSFEYSNNEQSLFPGQISAHASNEGFTEVESFNFGPAPSGALIPQRITHRFRVGPNAWPCIQLGLGIFTVNQVEQGYSWSGFKNSISKGLRVFKNSKPESFLKPSKSVTLVLRYNDAFFPSEESLTNKEYVEKHFNIDASLSENFISDRRIIDDATDISFRVSMRTSDPEGSISVSIFSAVIGGNPGLIMETIVESDTRSFSIDNFSLDKVVDWCEEAHYFQKHAFETLIKPSAYKL